MQKTQTETKQTAANLPKVTQLDDEGLKNLLKSNGKPLLVNFWATWCDPCREEFPDLVKIDAEYRGKIDFVTVSLDDVEEINTSVPKFLVEMKAEMPAFLLKSEDESALISLITKDWSGGLPFTILYNAKGEIAYFKQGKFKPDVLRAEIDKITQTNSSIQVTHQQIINLPKSPYTYEKGKSDAREDIANGKYIIRSYGLTPGRSPQSFDELRKKYGIEIINNSAFPIEYAEGYNEVSKAEIKRKFGLAF